MPKLALIDLSHVWWTTWHATAGQPVDTAATVTLQRIDGFKNGFDRVVICCDVGPSWRKREFPEYKAGRPERDPAAYDQLRRVREQLESEGLPTIGVEDYESDDVIATLACKAPAAGYDVTIFSGDKDLLQLVGGAVVVQSTNNGGGLMDREKVKEKFGVYPERLGDWLALVGDSSDNIPGLEGCGPKNATRLLNELGSLANMLEAPAGVTPEKMREKFIAQREQVILARKLVKLSTDVPIDFEEATAPRERKTRDDVQDGDFEEVDSGGAGSMGAGKEESADGQRSGAAESPAPPRASADVAPPKPAAEAESTALVLDRQDPRWMLALEPRNPQALITYCRHLAESQLYRKFPNADSIMAVVLRGRALGLDMTTSLDVFNVIKGKPTMGAMAIVGLCLASGKAEYFDPVESDSETEATWETKRVGRAPRRLTYRIDDAKKAGLLAPSQGGEPSNWIKRPKPMLRKQAAVELARLVYPDVVANIYDPDELTD